MEPHNPTIAKPPLSLGFYPFVLMHVAALGCLFVGTTPRAMVLAVVLYLVRMWAVTAGYHRYFAHRSFKTSRVFQFVLAVLAQTGAQRGCLWWASHHRGHHKHADTQGDLHSPVVYGFWHAHVGWLLEDNPETRFERVRDLAKYPELVWIDRHFYIPIVALALMCLAIAGLPGLFMGFFVSTVFLWHVTFLINSIGHILGTRRYNTPDRSRNNVLLALLTFGEGWHNNHHHSPSSARNGFRWWEIDITWYVLRLLEAFGIVWDLRPAPAEHHS
jgi:stearoyl-CoA desaturase (Delta-9 desaturase)